MAQVALDVGVSDGRLFLRLSAENDGPALSVDLDHRTGWSLVAHLLEGIRTLDPSAEPIPGWTLFSADNPPIRLDRDDRGGLALTISPTGLPDVIVKLSPENARVLGAQLMGS